MCVSQHGSAGLPGLSQRPDGGPFALGWGDTAPGVLSLLLPSGLQSSAEKAGGHCDFSTLVPPPGAGCCLLGRSSAEKAGGCCDCWALVPAGVGGSASFSRDAVPCVWGGLCVLMER